MPDRRIYRIEQRRLEWSQKVSDLNRIIRTALSQLRFLSELWRKQKYDEGRRLIGQLILLRNTILTTIENINREYPARQINDYIIKQVEEFSAGLDELVDLNEILIQRERRDNAFPNFDDDDYNIGNDNVNDVEELPQDDRRRRNVLIPNRNATYIQRFQRKNDQLIRILTRTDLYDFMFSHLTNKIIPDYDILDLDYSSINIERIIRLFSELIENFSLQGIGLPNFIRNTAQDDYDAMKVSIQRLITYYYYVKHPEWAYNFTNPVYTRQQIQNAHKIMLVRFLVMLSFIPISYDYGTLFVLRIGYRSELTGEITNKIWYLHAQSISYLATGLISHLTGPVDVNINTNDSVSDPISIITDIQHLSYVHFIPVNKIDIHDNPNDELTNMRSGQINTESIVFLPDFRVYYRYFKENNKGFQDLPEDLFALQNTPFNRGLVRRLRERMWRTLQRAVNDMIREINDEAEQDRLLKQIRDDGKAGFFPYYNLTEMDLSRYQIPRNSNDFEVNIDIYRKNCVLYALEMSGLFNESEIEQMTLVVNKRAIPVKCFNELCEHFDFKMTIHKYTEKSCDHKSRPFIYGKKDAKRSVELGMVKKHAFLIEKIPATKYYLDHYSEIEARFKDNPRKMLIRGFNNVGNPIYANESRWITSFDYIRRMVELDKEEPGKFLYPVVLSDVLTMDLTLYKNFIHKGPDREHFGSLEYNEELNLLEYKKKLNKDARAVSDQAKSVVGEKDIGVRIFYADFETFTVDNNRNSLTQHVPFMCCAAIDNDENIYTFNGPRCGEDFLDFVVDRMQKDYKNEAPLVYFHNLGYDINFLARYGISASMPRGRKMLNTEITYKNYIITLKDSASLIPAPLKAFGSMFHLPVEKEVFPYEYYTEDRYYKHPDAGVREVIDFMGDEWNFETKTQFIENTHHEETFNMPAYAEYYCRKDVEVLKKGLEVFRQGLMNDFEIDMINYLSISSIANAIFEKNVYSKVKDLYLTGGIVREFMQGAIHGGRVMCADNEKWAYRCDRNEARGGQGIVDFDAVSLYPSAMSRLWLVSGKPQVFTQQQLNGKIVGNPDYTAYVIDICITKINKPRHFPLVIGRNPCTHSVMNTNEAPLMMTVCDIELEDLVKYQEIEFIPVRGYYWAGQKSYEIQDCIRKIFNKRLEYKKEHNPLESIYKLIMNSIYGKTILKPIDTKLKYYRAGEKKLTDLLRKKSGEINYMVNIDNSNIIAVKMDKPINKHFNFSLFGIHILAMSKRIMNEVMCLAEDLGMQIYYQDTDSMHIENFNLDRLASEFKIKYDRDLIGTNLGQFHSDFDPIAKDSTNVRARESYFVGKKCYVDELIDDQGNVGYHIRMKGIPKASVIAFANEHLNGNVLDVYRLLCAGRTLTFDLLAGHQIKFDYTRSMTVKTKEKFERRVSFKDTAPPFDYENGVFFVGRNDEEHLGDLLNKF